MPPEQLRPVKQWRVELSQAARGFLRNLRDQKLKRRLGEKLDELAANPRPPGSEMLSASVTRWRVRVSDYRIIYRIQDDRLIVLIVEIGHRREIYR